MVSFFVAGNAARIFQDVRSLNRQKKNTNPTFSLQIQKCVEGKEAQV
jgi:hypothetical protein